MQEESFIKYRDRSIVWQESTATGEGGGRGGEVLEETQRR